MILPTTYRNKQVAVVGLARSGITAAQALTQAGALVHTWDDAPSARMAALAAGLTLTPVTALPWDRLSALILSPGIPHSWPRPHAAAEAARAAGVPILADVDLLLSTQTAARVIAITGTNGKSTTTALIAHILQTAQKRAIAGGNIGLPALSLPAYGAEGTYVLELSSYQLERVPNLSAHTAILLNISDDHLDRHGGIAGYIQAKSMIFQKQTAKDWAIVGMDDAPCRGIAERLEQAGHAARIVPISVSSSLSGGIYAEDGWLIDALDGSAAPIFKLEDASHLPGQHNAQNICAAYAAARQTGLARKTAVEAILGFPGLAHRQELVRTIDGVAYINDSKATNAHATERALVCYPSLHWIVGGRAKAGGIDRLVPHFSRIRGAYLIGEASDSFAETLAANGMKPKPCGTLDIAVKAAKAAARPGETILLSPACASFDQYLSFEHRGEHFRQLVICLAASQEGE